VDGRRAGGRVARAILAGSAAVGAAKSNGGRRGGRSAISQCGRAVGRGGRSGSVQLATERGLLSHRKSAGRGEGRKQEDRRSAFALGRLAAASPGGERVPGGVVSQPRPVSGRAANQGRGIAGSGRSQAG